MEATREKILRHCSELGRWEMVFGQPDSRIRPHVREYCGYDEETFAFSRRRELASGDVVLIVGFGPPIDISFPELGVAARATAFVSGLSDSYAFVDSFGRQTGVQIDLTPLGAHMLFGVPMSELANSVVALEDLLGPQGTLLPERLHDAPGWRARFAILDELLRARFDSASPTSPDVAWVWGRLHEAEGRLRVDELAGELGCSRRHLTARFQEQIGLPPKTLARLLRFGRAVRLIGGGKATDLLEGGPAERHLRLAEIAADCGYYDQPHLNRDFREFAGATPLELEGMLLPDGGGIQDGCEWPETVPQFPSVQDSAPGAS